MHYDGFSEHRPMPTWAKVVAAIAVVVIVIVGEKSLKSSVGGLLSGNSCSTELGYPVPKDKFQNVNASVSVKRCSSTESLSEKKASYVLVTLNVNGQPKDKGKVKALQTSIQLDRRARKPGGKWIRNVPVTDIPQDPGPSIGEKGDVAYQEQMKWVVPRTPAQVRVSLLLKTDKGDSTVERTIKLP
jgi:hypothetical protein